MSYCVNCGVELDESAKKCALCDTPIYNPNQTEPKVETPFSSVAHIPDGVKKRFITALITAIMVVPNIICLFVNMFSRSGVYWFIYVLASSVLAWILFVFPFVTKKPRPYLMWGFNTLTVAAYVYVFYAIYSHDRGWYYKIALPMIAVVSVCALIFIIWARKRKHHWSSKMLHIALDIVALSTVSCIVFYLFGLFVVAVIFFIIFLSMLVFTLFAIYCNRSKKVRAWLSKKLTY